MTKIVAIAMFAAVVSAAASQGNAAAVPCEQMLKDMRALRATTKLSDADAAKVSDLEAKGIERCNADDDVRADKFFADAMKIMGK